MISMKRLRRAPVVPTAILVCLALTGAVAASDRGAAAHRSLVTADGYVVSQGAKNNPLCALPRVCYSPALLQQAYDFPSGKKAPTGVGQTIVIVVPYGSPTIEADLATFDSAFNIAPPRSFSIVTAKGAGGIGSTDPDVLIGWGVETSASVEWAHAMAPGANIVLAVSPTDDLTDVVATEAQLLPLYPGAVVSQSFGDDETDPSAQDAFKALHDVFAAATGLGGTIFASAGDFGAAACPDPVYGCGSVPVASYPASDPLVTGVGGTEGNPYPGGLLRPHGGYGGEQVWNESDTFGLATGGAPSVLFDSPSYQQGITGNTARTVPDVSYNAAINGGIQVYYGLFGRFITFGGTSAGPPQWAAIAAIANEARAARRQHSLGLLNTALYAIAQDRRSYRKDFNDITVGTNALSPFPGFTFPGFNAGPGYDLATGLGTPDVERLIRDLVQMRSDDHSDDHGPHANGGGDSHGGQQGQGGQHHMKSGG